jgi:hypothetical protein
MRRMILRMIATGSLSAFSASALQSVQGVRAPSATPIQPVRAQSPSASTSQQTLTQPLGQSAAPRPGTGVSDRPAPRGSLLDLSV